MGELHLAEVRQPALAGLDGLFTPFVLVIWRQPALVVWTLVVPVLGSILDSHDLQQFTQQCQNAPWGFPNLNKSRHLYDTISPHAIQQH
jgi:hypothetical protein